MAAQEMDTVFLAKVLDILLNAHQGIFPLLDVGNVCSAQCSNLKFYTADMAFRPSGLRWQLLVKCGRHSIV
jgi:hypothetical protein